MSTEKPLFSSTVRDVFDSMASPLPFAANTVVFQEGDQPTGVYVVRKGSVRMTVRAGEKEVVVRVAEPGAVIGLPAVLGNQPYSLTARTVDESELGFVPGPSVVEAIRSNTELGLQVLRLLSEEVRAARRAMADAERVR